MIGLLLFSAFIASTSIQCWKVFKDFTTPIAGTRIVYEFQNDTRRELNRTHAHDFMTLFDQTKDVPRKWKYLKTECIQKGSLCYEIVFEFVSRNALQTWRAFGAEVSIAQFCVEIFMRIIDFAIVPPAILLFNVLQLIFPQQRFELLVEFSSVMYTSLQSWVVFAFHFVALCIVMARVLIFSQGCDF